MTPIQEKTFQAYPTYAKFLEDFNPGQLIVVYSDINSISKSVAVINPRLRLEDISIVYSSGKLNAGVDYVEKWLVAFNEISNLNKKLKETRAVAFMIYNKYKYFYLTDMKVIFDKIIECEYGIFYGSVDAPRILGAFVTYAAERAETFKSIRNYVTKEKQAYMNPLCDAEYKAIAESLKGKYSDEKEFRTECNRIYKEVAMPKLDKIGDEIEADILKKIQ